MTTVSPSTGTTPLGHELASDQLPTGLDKEDCDEEELELTELNELELELEIDTFDDELETDTADDELRERLDELTETAVEESTEDTALDETATTEEDLTSAVVEEGEPPPQPANSIKASKFPYNA